MDFNYHLKHQLIKIMYRKRYVPVLSYISRSEIYRHESWPFCVRETQKHAREGEARTDFTMQLIY